MSYFKHFHVVIGYALALLVTLFVNNYAFSMIGNDVAFVYTKGYGAWIYLLVLLAVVFSSLIYAMFTSILVFVVKRDLFQGVKKQDMVKHVIKSALSIFYLMLVVNIIYFILYIIFVGTFLDVILPILYIIVFVFIFYVPQSIVVDEEGIFVGLEHSHNFLNKHKLTSFLIFLAFVVLVLVIGLISTYIEGNVGLIIGLILNTVFVVPLLEIVKTIIYLTKFDIFDSYLKR